MAPSVTVDQTHSLMVWGGQAPLQCELNLLGRPSGADRVNQVPSLAKNWLRGSGRQPLQGPLQGCPRGQILFLPGFDGGLSHATSDFAGAECLLRGFGGRGVPKRRWPVCAGGEGTFTERFDR